MIAKRVINKKKTSSFKRCADYVTDQLNNGAKAASVCINNCMAEDYDMAVKEVMATQAMNTRTKNDKTYHLVISFPEGEIPTPEQLVDIEDNFCVGLGFGEHQRISAVHDNTENIHIHVAINKVHPRTFNCVEPYYDYYKLNGLCEALELKHGLQKDNRIQRKKEESLSPKATEIEHHSGLMTFESWVRSEALPEIKAVLNKPMADWGVLHQTLAEYDITLRPRGAGFVVSHRKEKVFIKSSSVWRYLSKPQLEKQLGAFVPPSTVCNSLNPRLSYKVAPVQNPQKIAFKQSRDGLYDTYRKGRNTMVATKRKLLAEVKLQQTVSLVEVKRQFMEQRQAIKNSRVLTSTAKRSRYEKLRYSRIKALAEINTIAKQGRERIHHTYSLNTWNDFLVEKAGKGNEQALDLLRYRQKKQNRLNRQDTLSAGNDGDSQTSAVYSNLSHNILKNGTVIYELLKQGKIKDTGRQITVHSGGDKTALAALQVAKINYGGYLNVTGTDTFKAMIVRLAVEHHPSIRFDDPSLEKIRAELTNPLSVDSKPVTSTEKTKGLER